MKMDEKMNNQNMNNQNMNNQNMSGEELGEGFQELSAEDLSSVWGGSFSFCPLCQGKGIVSGRKCPMCLGSKVAIKERLSRSQNED